MHTIRIASSDKTSVYREILPQIESLTNGEPCFTANLANIAAVLKEAFGWFWVGFYLVERASNELVLGPFQGPVACTRIPYGRGGCGQAAKRWWWKTSTAIPTILPARPYRSRKS